MSRITAFPLVCLLSFAFFSVHGCPSNELKALLTLKTNINDTYSMVGSWKGQNCCDWNGVTCYGAEGGRHVSELYLFMEEGSVENIGSSLSELKYLIHLDLTGIQLHGEIPSQLGNLSSLRSLFLQSYRGCGVYLNSFHVFSLSCNIDESLTCSNLEWLSNSSSLEYLSLSGVNVSDKSWGSTIGSLFHLKHLELSWSPVPAPTIPSALLHLTSLTFLDLSFMAFSNIPTWMGELSSLTHLHLSGNGIGSIPNTFRSLTRLEYLDLSSNAIGSIPNIFGNLTRLEHLDLSYNGIGSIPNTFRNLTRLEDLDLSGNTFTGSLPLLLAQLSSLIYLDVSRNHLNESIPNTIGNLTGLEHLDLRDNSLTGSLPLSFAHLSSLIYLDVSDNYLNGSIPSALMLPSALQKLRLSHNKMNGTITEVFFQGSFKLKSLLMYDSGLSINISSTWVPSFQLEILESRKCQIGGPIPSWISTQFSLRILDLSDTQLTGNLPSWLWDIEEVYLSHNHLQGSFTPTSGSLSYLDLSMNELSGHLPADIHVYLPNAEALNLADNKFEGQIQASIANLRNLGFLDISNNRLTGKVPVTLGNLSHLKALNLENNYLEGEIPKELGRLSDLWSLRIGKNSLQGILPSSLRNISELQVLDVGGNSLTGNIPKWISNFSSLQVLVMKSNKFTGNLPPEIGQMPQLQVLDLSSNFFSGEIPHSYLRLPALQNSSADRELSIYFGIPGESIDLDLVVKGQEMHYEDVPLGFTSFDLSNNRLSGPLLPEIENLNMLKYLNLSMNSLSGPIPASLGNLVQLESVDLSFNKFSGQIPSQLSNLTFLAHLNLSCNNLSGRIPHEQAQMITFDASSYIGNPNLWGCPLERNCSHPGMSPPPLMGMKKQREEGFEFPLYWMFFGFAVGVGFSVVVIVLVLKPNWYIKYFNMMDKMVDTIDRVKCMLTKPKRGDVSSPGCLELV